MRFIQHWKAYFSAIIVVGIFFILWDIYFAYQNVWGFNDQYLIGFRIIKLPIEEWLFFLFIPYSSVFIHYALLYFLPNFILNIKITQLISYLLFFIGLGLSIYFYDRMYTFICIGIFTILILLQIIFQWKEAQRFYLSFIIIYVPFFFVNNALTGAYSEKPVVFYNSSEIIGIRVGTMPLEDSFYCFALLYSIIILFEFLKSKKAFSSKNKI